MGTLFKCGFVGLMGPTNSGKSTLLNALVGQKVSIVSPRVQTTYHRVCGIVNLPSEQIIFVDTPGFQQYPERIAKLLNQVADRSGRECDQWVWVFDASHPGLEGQCGALEEKIRVSGGPSRVVCVLNKVDKIRDKTRLLPIIESFHKRGLFAEVVPVSAKTGDGIDRVLKVVRSSLKPGPRLFPEDMVTDRSEQFLVSELVRESIYLAAREEIPYATWVEIEGWEDKEKDGKAFSVIRAVIHVDSRARKKIVVGKQGHKLKEIGTKARLEIEKLLDRSVYLEIFVDVQEGWKNDVGHVSHYLELR